MCNRRRRARKSAKLTAPLSQSPPVTLIRPQAENITNSQTMRTLNNQNSAFSSRESALYADFSSVLAKVGAYAIATSRPTVLRRKNGNTALAVSTSAAV